MNLVRLGALSGSVLLILFGSINNRAISQGMDYPLAVVAASDDLFYVADRNSPAIWKIEKGKAEVYFQASKKFRAPLNAVRCLAIDREGRLLAGDSATREVYRFDASGKPEPLAQGVIGIPMDIDVNQSGDIFVADLEAHLIYVIPAKGGKPVEFVSVPAPRGLAVDQDNNIWVASHGPDHVVRFSPDKKREVVVSGQPFQFSHQIALTKIGDAYIADGYGHCIWKVSSGSKPSKWLEGAPLQNPVGLDVRGDQLLIADPHAKTIFSRPLSGGPVQSILKP